MAGTEKKYKAIFLACWCFLFGCCPVVLLAQTTVSTPKPITLELDDATLQEAYRKVFAQAGLAYSIQPEVAEGLTQTRTTLHVHKAPLEAVLYSLQQYSGRTNISYRIDKGVYIIEGPRVTLSLKAVSPSQALTQFFASIYADYIFIPATLGTAKITLDFKDEPVAPALKQLLQQVQPPSALSVQKIGDVYILHYPCTFHAASRSIISFGPLPL